MVKRITFKKGAEPTIMLPALVYIIVNIGRKVGAEITPEGAAAVAGFLYGVYRATRNFFKHRKK